MSESTTFKTVSYDLKDGVATIKLDDGRNNLISLEMLKGLNKALDQAEKDDAIVILTSETEVLSAGFDLQVLRHGVTDAFTMLIGGFKLLARMLKHPTPVIVACNGHAVAEGFFILLCGDYRIGVKGEYKYVANEVELGMNIPFTAMEVCRYKLKPSFFDRAVLMSEVFYPENGVEAGCIDKVVDRNDLMAEANRQAQQYKALDLKCHNASKLRIRKQLNKRMHWMLWADRFDIARLGVLRMMGK